jgi:hypothetical protein
LAVVALVCVLVEMAEVVVAHVGLEEDHVGHAVLPIASTAEEI